MTSGEIAPDLFDSFRDFGRFVHRYRVNEFIFQEHFFDLDQFLS